MDKYSDEYYVKRGDTDHWGRFYMECVDVMGRKHNPKEPAITRWGDYYWYWHGVLHRENAPAIETSNGRKFYYRNGSLHRDNGPAIVGKTFEEWFCNGNRHRVGGPAKTGDRGKKRMYYINDKLSRPEEEGPAIECPWSKEYWLDGKRHRLNGPAIITTWGYMEYWIFGKRYKSEKNDHRGKSTSYYRFGKEHRIDGPAYEDEKNPAYAIRGKRFSKEEYEKWIRSYLSSTETMVTMLTSLGLYP